MNPIGEVSALLRPLVSLIVRGMEGQEMTILTRLDTGFDLYLALPEAVIKALNLPFAAFRPVTTATGEENSLPEYRARVMWEGFERPVRVLAKPGDALVGMATFYGYRVCIDVIDGGAIESRFIE